MITLIRNEINKMLNIFGLKIVRVIPNTNWIPPVEATDFDRETITLASRYTMTSPERLWALISAVKYVVKNNLPGDFCECGVWRGGSVLAIARTLENLGITDRRIYLYDTFSGMTDPTDKDIEISSNTSARTLMSQTEIDDGNNVWAYASKADVMKNLSNSNYPIKNYIFVEGDILDTIQSISPSEISLLRLDTDWYESTKEELTKLYPKLVSGGVLIIDDYGHWDGSRAATDEYFEKVKLAPLLNYIDYTGRIGIKLEYIS